MINYLHRSFSEDGNFARNITVIWSHSGKFHGSVLPDSHRQVIDLDGSLIVQGVNENPDEGTYRCQYQVDKGREISYLIELKIIESPVISEFQFSPSSEVGMRMKVICAAILGDPPFQFRWLKDGDQLPISLGLSIQKFKDYSMLSTDNMQLKHGGNYTCQVTNEGGTASYSAVLKVNAPPRWVVEPKNTEVVEGGSARFDCSATGSPPPTIKWTKSTSESIPEDYTPVYNSHKHTLYPNGSLIIHRASEQEKGHYLCEATNGFGFDLSKLVHLKIHYPPKFEVKFKTHAVNKGDSVVLSVVARGDPPIQFFWEKGVYRIENDLRYRIETSESQNTAQKSTLTIIDTIREDSGIYTCSAKNHYGKDETRLQLLIQGMPF
ncbi:cell adhesion molecule Dscam2-like [Tachypleus tridentatus]|uniref:cell adhesion molecule Dscam2-like n=1 Tax=Tachypleus tridentatus TaxID=6853 RepID=UPI003FD3B656